MTWRYEDPNPGRYRIVYTTIVPDGEAGRYCLYDEQEGRIVKYFRTPREAEAARKRALKDES